MKWPHTSSYLQLQFDYEDMWIFLAAAIFKSLLLKMAATLMTVEFGNIHHYFSLEERKHWSLFVQFFEQIQQLTIHYLNYDLLVSITMV